MDESKIFNNREIALFACILIAFCWFLINKKTRCSIIGVIKALFEHKILIVTTLMFLYIGLITFILFKSKLWDYSFIKDTIYWAFGGAFIMFMNINDTQKKDSYFKRKVLENVRLIVILEYVNNLYVFNLITELVTIPIIIFTSLLKAYAEVNNVDVKVQKFINFILALYGLSVLAFSIYHVYIDIDNFITLDNLKHLLLPLVYTILYLPFLYVIGTYMEYELLFVRIDCLLKGNDELIKTLKCRIFLTCNINYHRIMIVSKELKILFVTEKSEINNALESILKKK